MEGDNARTDQHGVITRKTLFKAALIATPVPLLAGQLPALARDTAATGQPLTPTPHCDDGEEPTPPQIEGPYFRPGSPRRSVLPGQGTPLTVSGYVFGLACQPLAN
ncbi:MAG TPA: dioxygenase, partial [Nonomuraea sp.]|nr:dioxygenase [Nonomuraea sp.]